MSHVPCVLSSSWHSSQLTNAGDYSMKPWWTRTTLLVHLPIIWNSFWTNTGCPKSDKNGQYFTVFYLQGPVAYLYGREVIHLDRACFMVLWFFSFSNSLLTQNVRKARTEVKGRSEVRKTSTRGKHRAPFCQQGRLASQAPAWRVSTLVPCLSGTAFAVTLSNHFWKPSFRVAVLHCVPAADLWGRSQGCTCVFVLRSFCTSVLCCCFY